MKKTPKVSSKADVLDIKRRTDERLRLMIAYEYLQNYFHRITDELDLMRSKKTKSRVLTRIPETIEKSKVIYAAAKILRQEIEDTPGIYPDEG